MKLLGIVALLATALLLAGCGGDSKSSDDNGVSAKSAQEIVDDSLAAAKNASSVRVQGSITSDGSALEIDMQIVSGKGAAGHITTSGQTVQVVSLGGKVYLKGDDAFWTQLAGAMVAQLINGRWITAPASNSDFASFAALTDIQQLFESALGETSDELAKGDETTVDGTPAIAITDPTKDGTLYVATEGEPYPVKIESTGDAKGSISFTDWNESVELEAPTDAVDLSQLTGG